MESIASVVSLFVFAALFTPLFLAIYILRSIDLAAKRRQAKVKFFIVDLFSLIFLVQMPFALIRPEYGYVGYHTIIGFIVLACLIVWWVTIRTVSQAGIVGTGWRMAVSIVVIPSTFVGSFVLVGSCLKVWWEGIASANGSVMAVCLVGVIASLFVTRVALKNAEKQIGMGSAET